MSSIWTDDIVALLQTAKWKDTVYITAHQYIMAHWDAQGAYIVGRVRERIRTEGCDGEFGGRTWRYWDCDGWTYWMMPSPKWPFVLNRRRAA